MEQTITINDKNYTQSYLKIILREYEKMKNAIEFLGYRQLDLFVCKCCGEICDTQEECGFACHNICDKCCIRNNFCERDRGCLNEIDFYESED